MCDYFLTPHNRLDNLCWNIYKQGEALIDVVYVNVGILILETVRAAGQQLQHDEDGSVTSRWGQTGHNVTQAGPWHRRLTGMLTSTFLCNQVFLPIQSSLQIAWPMMALGIWGHPGTQPCRLRTYIYISLCTPPPMQSTLLYMEGVFKGNLGGWVWCPFWMPQPSSPAMYRLLSSSTCDIHPPALYLPNQHGANATWGIRCFSVVKGQIFMVSCSAQDMWQDCFKEKAFTWVKTNISYTTKGPVPILLRCLLSIIRHKNVLTPK